MKIGTGIKYNNMLNAIKPTAKPIEAAMSIFSCGTALPSLSYRYSDVNGHTVTPPGVQFIRLERKTALCNKVLAYLVCVTFVFSWSHGAKPLNDRTVPLAKAKHTQNM